MKKIDLHIRPRGTEKLGHLTRWQLFLCGTIIKLDKIPRYGRVFTYEKFGTDFDHWKVNKHWIWMRQGLWGAHLLDRVNLLWPYIFYYNPDILGPDEK